MTMRFFLWANSDSVNFGISKSRNLLGFPEGADYSWKKAMRLKPGDIVLIRDSNDKKKLKFFGCCSVIGEPYRENNELIWPEEVSTGQVAYSYRVEVDFDSVNIKNLNRIDWGDLLSLQWKNKRGRVFDKKGLSVLFSKGNFVEGLEGEKLAELLSIEISDETGRAYDFNPPSASQRVLAQEYRILRDTKLARDVKSLHDFKCQICGISLELANGKNYVEAHHIKPLGSPHDGPDTMENIICVCPNHHALLDYGAMRLETNLIQEIDKHKISEAHIIYHNLEIYERH